MEGQILQRIDWENFDEVNDFSYRLKYQKLEEGIKKLPQKERVEMYRFLCENDSYYLGRYIMGMGFNTFMDKPYAYARCQEVDTHDFEQGGLDGRLYLWFRGGFKSTILTVIKGVQRILRRKNMSRLIISYKAAKAKEWLQQIMRELESNEWLQAWYPDVLFKEPAREAPLWSVDKGIIVKRDSNQAEPTLVAAGLESLPTGGHYDEIDVDDSINETTVTTEEQKAKTIRQLELLVSLSTTMELVGKPPTEFYYVGTRYDDGDGYGHLEESGNFEVSKHAWHIGDGETPRAHTKDAIALLRSKMSSYIFDCQYELNPTKRSLRKFRRGLTTYDKVHEGWEYIMLCDPAGDGKKDRDHNPDYSAIAVIGLDYLGGKYFVDGIYDRMPLMNRMKKMFDFVYQYKIKRAWYEKVSMQSDTHVIETFIQNTGIPHFEVIPFSPKQYGSKNDRIERGLMPEIENASLRFPPCYMYMNSEGELIDIIEMLKIELDGFPRSKKDDMMDCLAQLIAVPIWGSEEHHNNAAPKEYQKHLPRNPDAKTNHQNNSMGKQYI